MAAASFQVHASWHTYSGPIHETDVAPALLVIHQLRGLVWRQFRYPECHLRNEPARPAVQTASSACLYSGAGHTGRRRRPLKVLHIHTLLWTTMEQQFDTPAQLAFERAFYIGSYLTAILFGVQLFMFFLSNYFLLYSSPDTRKESVFYVFYGSVMLLLWTVAHSCNAIFGQLIWIDHRDVVGGPAAFLYANLSAWYNTLGTVTGICMNFLADGLLLYRCFIIWGSSFKIVAMPIVLYFGAMSMAILLIYESAIPGASFFSGDSVSFGVPYFWMTISLNIITTSLICGRLLSVRSRVRALLGEQHCQTYTGVVACLLESALPFTVLGIVYVITYARKSPYSFAFLQVWADFCAISPQLIILRVATGKAWSKATVASVSVLVFDHRAEKGWLSRGRSRDCGDEDNIGLDITLPQGESQGTGTDVTTVDSMAGKDRGIAV
ncbi:hypothetical protein GGX14DRAFT_423122 [Mycena pura]|uniref:Uncharacterized protein n=1 Tax=Mycena pura TaxID=153505 RepID=A0AAD7E3W9_9AGAR|nr:hypothetical protein GGX14DRAFT_423122 [Mycena pura]